MVVEQSLALAFGYTQLTQIQAPWETGRLKAVNG